MAETEDTFALLEWLGENLFSVLPLRYAKNPERCKAGACSVFKWNNPRTPKKPPKLYKVLVLKISSELKVLNCHISAIHIVQFV